MFCSVIFALRSFVKKDKFLETCKTLFPDTGIKDPSEIVVEERDKSDYVLRMKAGEKECTGEEFRSAFSLSSSCFTLTELGDQVRIVTRGIGHGIGMSQNMAQVMADAGKDYRQILSYFYQGAEVESAKKSQ